MLQYNCNTHSLDCIACAPCATCASDVLLGGFTVVCCCHRLPQVVTLMGSLHYMYLQMRLFSIWGR